MNEVVSEIIGRMFAPIIVPILALLVAIVFLLVALQIPALIANRLAFDARHTSYRTVRFHFESRHGEAYALLAPLLVLLPLAPLYVGFVIVADIMNFEYSLEQAFVTLPFFVRAITVTGVALLVFLSPYHIWRYHRYKVSNHSFGSLKPSFNAKVLSYYAAVIAILAGGAAVVLSLGWVADSPWHGLIVALVILYALFLLRSALSKLMLNGICFENGRIRCDYNIFAYAWVLAFTFALTVLSVWLLRPMSVIVRTRMLVNSLSVVTFGTHTLDSIISAASQEKTTVGNAGIDNSDPDLGIA